MVEWSGLELSGLLSGEGDAWLGWWVGGLGTGPGVGIERGREGGQKRRSGISETCAGAGEKTWIGGRKNRARKIRFWGV